MRHYTERVVVPAFWWPVGALCVLMMGSMVLGAALWAQVTAWIAVAAYAVFSIALVALFLRWGGREIEVTDTEVRSGDQSLPLGQIGRVAALDREQTRELRGALADPAAYLLVRPYLPESVYIEVAGQPAARPYWLLGTRKPAALAAAIEGARAAAGRPGACDDDAGGGVATAAVRGSAHPAGPGKESNAGKASRPRR